VTSSLTRTVWLTSGVNFTKILRPAFTRVDLKRAKRTDSLTALLGSMHVKASRKMLVKLTSVDEIFSLNSQQEKTSDKKGRKKFLLKTFSDQNFVLLLYDFDNNGMKQDG